jgi:hypothetical protein
MPQRIPVLERKIERIQRELSQLGNFRLGSLSQQFNICGTPGCRCKAAPPRRHGPYYQLSFTRKGKSHSQFVRREELPAVRRQLKNYNRFRALVEEWIDLAMELSNLRLKPKKSRGGK